MKCACCRRIGTYQIVTNILKLRREGEGEIDGQIFKHATVLDYNVKIMKIESNVKSVYLSAFIFTNAFIKQFISHLTTVNSKS